MIPGVLAVWEVAAFATDRLVTNTNPGNVAGSLRSALAAAAPGDDVVFDQGVFPPGSQTTILLTTASGGGLTLATAGVRLEAEGRVRLRCADPMTSGTGLTVSGNDAAILGLRVSDCPDHGILLTGGHSTVNGGEVDGNDKFGLLLEGAAATVVGNVVIGLSADGNCASTTATCAGIGQRRGVGVGAGPSGTNIISSQLWGQGGSGHGVSIAAGDATVSDALVGVSGGNLGHGILCAALPGQSATVVVERSTIVGNGGSGISLGARCQGATINDNRIGTTGSTALGNGGHGIEIFGSDDHALRRNVVADNAGSGVWVGGTVSNSPPERLLLRDNVIGLAADEETLLGNGADGVSLTGATGVSTLHSLLGNTIAGNAGDGVKIAAQEVTLTGNRIGTNRREQSGLGNTGDGVEITSGGTDAKLQGKPDPEGAWDPNVVSYNGGSGVNITTVDTWISWNRIGRNVDHGVRLGGADDASILDNRIVDNGAVGVYVTSGSDRVTVERNELRENGTYGISADASNTQVRWSANSIGDNGSCGLFTVNGLNGSSGTARPVITHASAALVKGTYTVPAGRTLQAIEIFSDADTEYERFLGTATAVGGNFTWRAGDLAPLVGAGDHVTAIALFDSNYTSRPLGWCGDGCGGTGCGDGNACTSDTCNAGVCSHANTNNNQACEDGNDCTTGTTCHSGVCNTPTSFVLAGTACDDASACTASETCDGAGTCTPDPAATTQKCDKHEADDEVCTADRHTCDATFACEAELRRSEGYHCRESDDCTVDDVCTFDGVCASGPTLEACPEQRPGLLCTCQPANGCACEAIEGDGCCTPDELETDANGDLLSPDCDDNAGPSWDEDGDGFPDLWEEVLHGIDANCDGDATDPGEAVPFNPNSKDVFWELDEMAPSGGHDHVFSEPALVVVVESYARGEITATIEAGGAVPHVDLLTDGDAPDEGSPSWLSLGEAERGWFTWARRGVYHYAVNGHRIGELSNGFNPGRGGPGGLILGLFADSKPENVFFHEAGHTHGLGHGPGKTNRNVNHLSIMNYWHRQLWDVRAGEWVLDYSHDNLNDLDEGALSEDDTFFPGASDADGDGWPKGSDCAPQDAARYPCADDPVGDGIDQDCDGVDGPRKDECQAPAVWEPLTKPLYLARWRCPVPGDIAWEYWAPPHADLATSTAAARRVDLDCDGVAGGATTAGAGIDGNDDLRVHFGQDDWSIVKATGLHFQTTDAFAGRARRYAEEEEPPDPSDDKRPEQPFAKLYDGCASPLIPTNPGYLVPVVVYGDADYDPNGHARIRLNGVEPVVDLPTNWPRYLVVDAYLDRILWYETDDLVDRLAPGATRASIWAEGEPDGHDALPPYAFAHFDIPARPASATDTDGDGIPNGCDQCPTVPGNLIRPDGCP